MWKKILLERQKLIKLGEKYGLTHPLTIKHSQKLDKILNDYYRYQAENKPEVEVG